MPDDRSLTLSFQVITVSGGLVRPFIWLTIA